MSAWFGLIGAALCIAAVATLIPGRMWHRRLWAGLALAASLIPLPGGDSAAMWLHALIGTPSATLFMLALLACLGLRPGRLEMPVRIAFLLIALEFYVLALGVGQLDVYGVGYRSGLLIVALFPVGLWLFHRRRSSWLMILTAALLSYAVGIHANLWDALFDPLVCVLALLSLRPQRRPLAASGASAR